MAFYPEDKSEPVILPEILTNSVLDGFEEKNVLLSNETELSFMVLVGFAWLGDHPQFDALRLSGHWAKDYVFCKTGR